MYTYDVFISYCHTDGEWVSTWLIPRLEDFGIKLCVDRRNFAVGAPVVENIESAVAQSRHILLVLTPSWLDNHWRRFEFLLSKQDDPGGARRRTLPLIRKPCDGKLPPSISLLTCADFTVEANNEEVFLGLLKSIDGAHRRNHVIDIPFVIAAMNRAEAHSLFEEENSIFNHSDVAPNEREHFQQFMEALQEWNIVDWISLYGNQRDDWKPFKEKTIHSIIEDIADHINATRDETSSMPHIRPRFCSADFFAADEHTRWDTWRKLGHSGCILIIDPVSLFHPGLRKLLGKSEISSKDRVAILGFSPIGYTAIRANMLIEEAIKKELGSAYSEFSRYLNKMYEFGVGDLRALQRWLFAIMPEAMDFMQSRRPNPDNIKSLKEAIPTVPGVNNLIFGG